MLLVCILVLGSGLWLARKWQNQRHAWTTQAERILQYTEKLGPEGREKYRNLAKWYNYNLDQGTPGLWSYYPGILDLGGGAMAVLEVPEWDLLLPVLHGTGAVVGHDPSTPLPIGGRGTHTVLTISHWLPWKEGQRLYIECLEQKLCYRVESVRVLPALWPTERPTEAGQEILTLVFDRKNTRTMIRCLRCGELELREQTWRGYAREVFYAGLIGVIFISGTCSVRKMRKKVPGTGDIAPKKHSTSS